MLLADVEESILPREQAQVAGTKNGRVDAVAPMKKEKRDQPVVSSVGQASEADRFKVQRVAGEDDEAASRVVRERESATKQESNKALQQHRLPAPARVAPVGDRAEQKKRSNEVADALLEAEPEVAGLERGIVGGKAAPAVVLPKGAVAAGTVELRDPAETQRLFAEMDNAFEDLDSKTESLSSNRPRSGGRLLVIGSRRGLDACDALEIRATIRAWEIRFLDSGSSTGSVSCGIEFPEDGREIRFLGELVDER
jgi:hypothetical protein